MPPREEESSGKIVTYDLYLKGLYVSLPQTSGAIAEANRHFEMATKHDPTFAPALVARAYLNVLAGGGRSRPRPRRVALVNPD
jgi:hypothetical protein